jgi:hypothetical protein
MANANTVQRPSKLRGLRVGNPGNRGGGRKPWVFKEEMQRALQEGDAGTVVKKIISGDILEVIATSDDGTPVVGDTKNADRLKAIQIAASYAEGLPVQPTIDLTPLEHKAAPVVAILAALGDPHARALVAQHPELGARTRMLNAVEVEGSVVE